MTWEGTNAISMKLMKMADRWPRKAGDAIDAEFLIEIEESKRRTPVSLHGTDGNKPGFLRDSHKLISAEISGNEIKSTIDVTAPYALPVHERTDVFHRVGRAKFLESTVYESRRNMGARIARRLDVSAMRF